MQMAMSDVNAWLANSSSPVRFQLVVEDTETDPAISLQKLQTLASQGIQVVVTGQSSAETRNQLAYMAANHIVEITGGSSAPDLSHPVPNPYFFRLIAPDDACAIAWARLVSQLGYKAVIVTGRSDTWGDDIWTVFQQRFTQLNGTIIDYVPYTPVTTGTQDFTPQLTLMSSDYATAVTKYGASKVAIIAISWEEVASMYQQAQTSYPALLNAVWFGSPGSAESTVVLSSSGKVAAQVKSISLTNAPTRSAKWTDFANRIVTQMGGGYPDPFSGACYDAVWVAALSILYAGSANGAAVQKVVRLVANQYYGVTGWPDMNAYNDRAIQDYDIFEVQIVNGTPQWVYVGTYSAGSDSVTFTQTP
jgi:branched-chain amino acid transport system substrate-binding protein